MIKTGDIPTRDSYDAKFVGEDIRIEPAIVGRDVEGEMFIAVFNPALNMELVSVEIDVTSQH